MSDSKCVFTVIFRVAVSPLPGLIAPLQATCKHFDVHTGPENIPTSRFSFDAVVSYRDWIETFQPAFKACGEAGAMSYMCSYNAINGVPSCANRELLTDLLRDTWNFDGFVVSDCGRLRGKWWEGRKGEGGGREGRERGVGGKEGRGRWREGRESGVEGRKEGREGGGGITLFSLVVGWMTSYHGDVVAMGDIHLNDSLAVRVEDVCVELWSLIG